MRRTVGFFVCFLFAAISPAVCIADAILPVATAIVSLGDNQSGQIHFNGYSPTPQTLIDSGAGVLGAASGASNYGDDPSVSTSLSLTGTIAPGMYLDAQSTAIYEFVVNGPANQSVSVHIAGSGQESISPVGNSQVNMWAQSSLQVWQASVAPASPLVFPNAYSCVGNFVSTYCNAPATSVGFFNVDETIQITSGTDYEVELFSEVFLNPFNSRVTPNGTGDLNAATYIASASVDPTITLDTTDPAYSLEFSAAPTPVPEPNYLGLTSACLAIGVVVQRRRRELLARSR